MSAKLDLSGVPECVDCGACCFSTARDYLRVAGVDFDRLGDDAERLTIFIENRAYMKIEDGHCAALTFEKTSGTFLCSVYANRPDVCRWLERGAGQCAAERHQKFERPIELRRKATAPS